MAAGIVIRLEGNYQLAADHQAAWQRRTAEAANLEHAVKSEWFAEAMPHAPAGTTQEALWACLSAFLSSALDRHGAQTLRLLAPDAVTDGAGDSGLTELLDRAIISCGANCDRPFVADAVRRFFSQATVARTAYLAQLLNATFTFFALTVDEVAARYLQAQPKPLSIFLDTNFIFGLLNLHVNPLEDVSEELIALIHDFHLPFKLYYHTETLCEIQRTIGPTHDFMRQHRYSQALSRAAVQSGRFSGIELRYHEINADTPISIDDFFAKFDHVPELLEALGCVVYRPHARELPSVEEKGPLIAEYDDFVKKARPERPKSYPALDHDIVVWWTIQKRRSRSVGTLLDVGALFLTADYLFYRFDWQKLRKRPALGTTVLPSQLLQFIRPFVSRTDELDRRLVEALSLPEFRAAGGDLNRVASRVLAVMATYADVAENTAAGILSNELLLGRLRDVADSPERLQEAVESELMRQNSEARTEVLRLRSELEEQRTAAAAALLEAETRAEGRLHDAIENEREERRQLEASYRDELAAEGQKQQGLEDRLAALERMQAAESQRRRRRTNIGLVAGATLIMAVTGVLFGWVSPFAPHPHRTVLLALSEAFWLVVLGGSLRRRWGLAGSLLIAIALAVTALIYY